MGDYLKLLLRKGSNEIILRVGTKNVEDSQSSQAIAKGISNLGGQVKENSPKTNVSISDIIVRKDKASIRDIIKENY